jgi:hypothetical protein
LGVFFFGSGGISLLPFLLTHELTQSAPTLVLFRWTRAGSLVQILPAAGTKAPAVRTAERLHREDRRPGLAHRFFQVQLVVCVNAERLYVLRSGQSRTRVRIDAREKLFLNVQRHGNVHLSQTPTATLTLDPSKMGGHQHGVFRAKKRRAPRDSVLLRLRVIDEHLTIDLILAGRADGFSQQLGNVVPDRHVGTSYSG